MKLEGKTALVTGGAVRLGRSLATALATRGVRVAVHYAASEAAAVDTVSSILDAGGEAERFSADLRRTEEVTGLVDRVVARFGVIDILVNNAAIFYPGDLETTDEWNWDEHFALNLKAPFFLSRQFVRQLGGGEGQIINIADWRAIRPGPDYIAYTITKRGIITMTESLALALAPRVRVNAIAPGAILPPPGKNASYLEDLAERIPLQRSGSPQDVAEALFYLLEAGYVTGQTIFVNGGQHL
ncbi:pteridine reductase [Geobacter sp. DSM 9736]|nr:pteridine reductase [Geobacter sp. DSM 9736]